MWAIIARRGKPRHTVSCSLCTRFRIFTSVASASSVCHYQVRLLFARRGDDAFVFAYSFLDSLSLSMQANVSVLMWLCVLGVQCVVIACRAHSGTAERLQTRLCCLINRIADCTTFPWLAAHPTCPVRR